MKAEHLLACIVVLAGAGVLAGQSYAEIDPESIVGIWLFDEGAGDVVRDSSKNGCDGEIAGDIQRAEGRFGEALLFPGAAGNRVRIPHRESLDLDTWSIALWAKLQDLGTWQWWFSKEAGFNGPKNFALVSNPEGTMYTAFNGIKSGHVEITSEADVHDDEWHHLAATYDMKMLRLYIDGTPKAEKAVVDSPVTFKTDAILGERLDSDNFIKGMIDELGLFNTGLSEDEVKDIMTHGLEEASGLAAVSPAGSATTTWALVRVAR